METKARTWIIEDHLCYGCGGRILKCATGQGMSPGGNPLFKCADCGKAATGLGPDVICWCGMHHRNNHLKPYRCLPFSILKERPEAEKAFRACGCDPSRGEVGIVLASDFR